MAMINVQLEDGAPITQMDESLLRKNEIHYEDDNEKTYVLEYWLGDRCVHRAPHVHLKSNVVGEMFAESIG
jgi:hypothetical protein